MAKTQEALYKKNILMTQIATMVWSDLESDITVSEVKCALGGITTNKASGGEGIPAELFQILKDDTVKFCTKYARKFGKLVSLATGLEKVCFHSNPKEE